MMCGRHRTVIGIRMDSKREEKKLHSINEESTWKNPGKGKTAEVNVVVDYWWRLCVVAQDQLIRWLIMIGGCSDRNVDRHERRCRRRNGVYSKYIDAIFSKRFI